MSLKQVQHDIICENIGCGQKLGYFDLKNSSRFCHKCRYTNEVLVWKCKGCDNRLYSTNSRETRKLCDDCKGLKIKF